MITSTVAKQHIISPKPTSLSSTFLAGDPFRVSMTHADQDPPPLVPCRQGGGDLVTGGKDRLFFTIDTRKSENFRSHPAGVAKDGHVISVSGSTQPTPDEIQQMVMKKGVGMVVDLREEAHGFIKSRHGEPFIPLSLTNKENNPNVGISRECLRHLEQLLFSLLESSGWVKATGRWPTGRFSSPVQRQGGSRKPHWVRVQKAATEEEMVDRLNATLLPGYAKVKYFRIPVTDEKPPRPEDVEAIVRLYQTALDAGTNVYFHCRAGHGRTTTAMALTRIMDGRTAEEALDDESNRNPILEGKGRDLRQITRTKAADPGKLRDAAARLGMIFRFADYWRGSRSGSFTEYMKGHPMDDAYITEMISRLVVVSDSALLE